MNEVAQEMTKIQYIISRVKGWWWNNVTIRLPKLVWHGDELDVCVRFSEDAFHPNMSPDEAFEGLETGSLSDIEKQLGSIGISFDKCMGYGGRDWEWDWSLKGPISVSFKQKAKKPELRKARPKLKIVH